MIEFEFGFTAFEKPLFMLSYDNNTLLTKWVSESGIHLSNRVSNEFWNSKINLYKRARRD